MSPSPAADACWRPVPVATHAERLGWPQAWTPPRGRAWRARLTDLVRCDLRHLWTRACARARLVDDATPTCPVPLPGLALACVGSLARRQLGPCSDLDLVVLYDPGRSGLDEAELARLAENLWYPLWDAGIRLDHTVRSLSECQRVATIDLPAAVGLLDVTHVAGDADLTSQAASALLTDWRRATRKRLGEVTAQATARAERFGEVAGRLEPDLKEARGGLRDAVLVRALVASSLTERPSGDLDGAVDVLLGVRDALALTTGRDANRLAAPVSDDVAALLGLHGRDELLAMLYPAAHQVARALEAATRTAERAARPARTVMTIWRHGRRSAPVTTPLDQGVALVGQEVALDAPTAQTLAGPHGHELVASDPALPLRVALACARGHAPLAVPTRVSLGRWATVPGQRRPLSALPARPQPARGEDDAGQGRYAAGEATMLDLLVELAGSADGFVSVWEDIDQAGLAATWLPGWEEVRHRPQHNPLHTWTVDRHMVRTAALAGELYQNYPSLRQPSPRRVLLLAALLHDLGKADGGEDHARAGARRVGPVLQALGVEGVEAREVTWLVRHHLLLSGVAARPPHEEGSLKPLLRALTGAREPDGASQSGAVGTPEPAVTRLEALRVLTEADARAAGPRAWSLTRSSAVEATYRRARARLGAQCPPAQG